MTGIEERLREDLKEFAQRAQPGTIRPLRAPPPRRKARAARWLAPVAAAVAVAGVVAGVTLAGRWVGNRPAGHGQAGMPSYYVTVVSVDRSAGVTQTAYVYDSATGRLLDSVPVPRTALGSVVTAAANDRLFAVGNDNGRAYLLSLAADGGSARLSRVRLDTGEYHVFGSAELSPNGEWLAIQVSPQHCHSGLCRPSGLEVFSLMTGAHRTWWTTAVPAWKWSMSWTASSEQLLFVPLNMPGAHYRLLSITSGGANLMTASTALSVTRPRLASGLAFLTSGGRTLVTTETQVTPSVSDPHYLTGEVVELSVSTGRLRVLYSVTTPVSASSSGDGNCALQTSGPGDGQFLARCFGLGRIRDGTFTPLPRQPSQPPGSAVIDWSAGW